MKILLLAAFYFVAGKLGLKLAFVNASATAVWAPTGITLAALLVLGDEVWPGIFLGAFLVNVLTAGSMATSLAVAGGNTLEGLVGAALIRRFARGPEFFKRAENIFKFVGLAAMVSTMVSATIGVTSLCLGGFVDRAQYGSVWLTWWLGDAAGDIMVAPLLLLWISNPRVHWSKAKAVEAFFLLATLFIVGQIVFGGWLPVAMRSGRLSFICLPVLIWAAYRFDQREAVTASFLMAAIALWDTLRGRGPFLSGSPNDSLLLLQAFMGVGAIMSMIVAVQRESAVSKLNEALETEIGVRKRSEEVVRTVLGNMAEGVIVVSQRGQFALTNHTAEKILGKPPPSGDFSPERWSRHYGAFLPDKTTVLPPGQMPMALALHGQDVDDFEVFVRNPEVPQGVWIQINSRPLKDEHGTIIGGVSVFRDVTQSKKAQEELQKKTEELSRSNVELEQFATIASHDLQEPLRKIISYGDLFKKANAYLEGEQVEYVEKMQEAARRMRRFIEAILELARVGSDVRPFEPLNLGELVRVVIADFQSRAAETGGEIIVGPLPVVMGDDLQMRQLFANLLSNACKFRKKDEPLRISISYRQQSEDFATIIVEDNGIGFDEKDRERIFKPFQRLHRRSDYEGSGLGLAICSRIVLRHGGEIAATSRPGEGSTFLVTLPTRIGKYDRNT